MSNKEIVKKKVFLRTFGCQMNDRDNEALLGLFLEKGYKQVDTPEEADVILVNTCSVRDHAENRAISFLGSLKKLSALRSQLSAAESRKLKAESKKIIGLIGCMARNRGEELFKKMPYIDLVCGPAGFDTIPIYIEKIQTEGQRIFDIADKKRAEALYEAIFRQEKDYASVVISTGCSSNCSYCVVPFVRGPLRFRSPKDIIDEIKRNVELGIKRITLLGQNVNDYNYQLSDISFQLSAKSKNSLKAESRKLKAESKDTITFVDLLKEVDKVEGLKEVDFITSHPKNTSRELFEVMAKSKRILKHLHLPFQSGSDRILELMNRGYSKEKYLRLIDEYKKIVAGTLSADIIVGFPTETKEDFLHTKDVIERVRFRYAYIFKYSPRPNTKAAKLNDDVPKEVKEQRHKVLLELQKKISLEGKTSGNK